MRQGNSNAPADCGCAIGMCTGTSKANCRQRRPVGSEFFKDSPFDAPPFGMADRPEDGGPLPAAPPPNPDCDCKTDCGSTECDGPRIAPGNTPRIPAADGGGMRHNAGKNQIELLPPEWVWGLGIVMTRGAIKYEIRNWERGMRWAILVGCALRHLFKFVCGERYDKETGCHHLFMVAWNACALATYDIRAIGENDLVGKLDWLDMVATVPGPELQKIIDQKDAKP